MSADPPPLYKPELIEPKKRLTLLQRCYKEPWVPAGEASTHTRLLTDAMLTRVCDLSQAA